MPVFLHAAHQVRQTFDSLALVSWLAIGIGVGAVVLSWGRVVVWLRRPENSAATLRAWGQDEGGFYFEISNGEGAEWIVEQADGATHLLTLEPGSSLLRAAVEGPDPSLCVPRLACVSNFRRRRRTTGLDGFGLATVI